MSPNQYSMSEIIEFLKEKKLPLFIMMVGVPGSGKSTDVAFIKEHVLPDAVVASSDAIIEREAAKLGVNYTEAFNAVNQDSVQKEFWNDIQEALDGNKSLIVDRTNLSEQSRKRFMNMVPDYYMRLAFVYRVDDTELKNRLQARESATGKHIPDNVMENMKKTFKEPTKSEGFDVILCLY